MGKNIYLTAIVILFTITCAAREVEDNRNAKLIMFWNLENFFDWIDQGTGESDTEFSSTGSRYWTRRKFYAKCDAVAKSIMWVGDRCGRMPDIIGFAEIENRRVLEMLIESTLLRKFGYEIVHFDSTDRRGIDVALIFRSSMYELVSSIVTVPEHQGEILQTRDILSVRLKQKSNGKDMDFIVNHHPSKFGGSKASEGRRLSVMMSLSGICDSLLKSSETPYIVAMGDFNDSPDGKQFGLLEGKMVNKALELHEKGEGTIRYEGKWDLIDMFLTSPQMEEQTEMEIMKIPFLMTRERKHPGEKPLRTYSGPQYIGGVSDHCPIILWISDGNS